MQMKAVFLLYAADAIDAARFETAFPHLITRCVRAESLSLPLAVHNDARDVKRRPETATAAEYSTFLPSFFMFII